MSKSHVGMSICFWCGDTKEIILDRRLKDTLEHQAIYDLDPCTKCQEGMDSGTTVFESTQNPEKMKEFPEHMHVNTPEGKVVFTGRYVVLDPNSDWVQEFAKEEPKIMMEDKLFEQVFGEMLAEQSKSSTP